MFFLRRDRPGRTAAATSVLAAGALLLSACGSGSTSAASTGAGSAAAGSAVVGPSASANSGTESSGAVATSPASSAVASGPTTVSISITDAKGCVATPDTVPAGAVTFDVENLDATGITELELISAQRIVGERENLTPGFSSTFTVKVDGGSYQIYCPGGATEKIPFTVTGKAAATNAGSSLATLLQQAAVDYGTYVDNQIEFLIPPVEELVDAIKADNLRAAQEAYAKACPFYERIEPVAESFPDLDSAIDLRIGDVEAGTEWTGFHPIEKALFVTRSTKGLSALGDKLLVDVEDLQTKAKALSAATVADNGKGYQPFEIANGASGLLDEVLKSKITGEEEAYSRIDLLDFQANVEGSLQAFATLQPALDDIDPTLVPTISAKFDALSTALDAYRDSKALGGWTPYPDLTAADKKKLTDALLAVQEPMSAISAKITK
ncbi:iron uptake system component EfeO [Nakamurella sp. UYEF19]|uniref:iron uptake system protein EfeO n=1 Tax=Nakamurella sp. UYEF19 TaxID=1756392 RepID=UPI0033957144